MFRSLQILLIWVLHNYSKQVKTQLSLIEFWELFGPVFFFHVSGAILQCLRFEMQLFFVHLTMKCHHWTIMSSAMLFTCFYLWVSLLLLKPPLSCSLGNNAVGLWLGIDMEWSHSWVADIQQSKFCCKFQCISFLFLYYKLLSNIGFAVSSHILDSCGLVPKWTRKEIFTIHFVRT